MPEKKISISPTQLGNMDCRLKWHWGTRKGLRKKGMNVALDMGSALHAFLETYYMPATQKEILLATGPDGATDPFVALQDYLDTVQERVPKWDDDQAKFNEMSALAFKLAKGYIEHWGKDPYVDWDILSTEQNLSIPLMHPTTKEPTKYRLFARLDGVVYDRTLNRYYSLEHKTFSSFDVAGLEQNPQFTIQVAVGQSVPQLFNIEQPLSGVIYNGIRKQAPGPRVRTPIYRRETLTRNPTQVKAMMTRVFHTAELFYGEIEIPIYPEPDQRKCGMCDFRDPCKAFSRGEDPHPLLEAHYVVQRPPTKSKGLAPKPESGVGSALMETDDAD